MARTKSPIPTPVEGRLLRLLWHGGPQTVGQLVEGMSGRHYNTVLTILRIMASKQLVKRGPSAAGRSHLYAASVSKKRMRVLVMRYAQELVG